jgi:hypothetical protein
MQCSEINAITAQVMWTTQAGKIGIEMSKNV